MSYSYLDNIELEKALEIYVDKIIKSGVNRREENVKVLNSLGRVTSEAVYAAISSPHYNACAMDGIAVSASSTFGASDTTPVILEEEGDFVRVDTGDPLPERFDAVVMIEDVIEAGEGKTKLVGAVTPWQNVRQIGEDICANEMIIPSNTVIEPAAIGAIMAGGIQEIRVWKKPLAGIIPTGDEIVKPTGNPGTGEIIEFNSSVFSAILEKWGVGSKVYDIVPDKYDQIKAAVQRAAEECDVVIVNAGSSAGREDFTCSVIRETGEVVFHGIAIKPGKPTILGIVDGCPVIGVPGYPVSGIIVMEKVVKKVAGIFTGMDYSEAPHIDAILSRKLVSSLKYKEFVRVKLGNVGERTIATPLNRGAGVITSFVKADGILEIPLNSEGIENGSKVRIQLLRSEAEIKNTLVLTGSHDPLIDVVMDMLRRMSAGEYISSTHVGSMGGIMAVKRREAHMAGIHLLDEATGEYNKNYIERYLDKNKCCLIKCVKRVQGFMTAPGNPNSIRNLSDICKSKKDGGHLRYVNRQKGSGTRILLDYLLRKALLDPSQIYGYEREEFTHLAVAALVASGSADAGMGIMSAAKAYGLDFIPVSEEEYDFLVPEEFMEHKIVLSVIDILKSVEFRETLGQMGGYVTDHCGEVCRI